MKLEKLETYMKIAHAVKEMSSDDETQVGAVMLSSENRIIASSFNGFLRGADDNALPRTRPGKYEFIQHAERNLLYNCAYEGIRTKDTTIICTLSPCLDCLRACYQSGVKTIIFDRLYSSCSANGFYETLADVTVVKTQIGKYTKLNMMSTKEGVELFEKELEEILG
jgi:dCMP deaminase